ncbi:MAG: class I SAM-dependent methyltransferase, partial [Myxococcales bacterium]|nr:class I SAM-dependent methyltransferase [Myxococcales bacterium]
MRVEDPVAVQYSRWPYPDAAVGLEGRLVWNDPAVYAPLYWPDRAPPAGLEVLIAGCGTAEAAALAARNPTARVLGVDISGPAIASQRALVERYGLRNVELRECAVEDVAALGRKFDFISVAGVLHHLADPAAGLRALGAVLRP